MRRERGGSEQGNEITEKILNDAKLTIIISYNYLERKNFPLNIFKGV